MNRIAFVLTRMASASLLSACFLLGMSSCGKEAARSSSITRCFVKDSCATLSCGKEKLPIDVLYPTDLLAVAWYRRHADWKIVLRLLPWAFAGLALGSWTLRYISDEAMRPLLGAIVLILAALNVLRARLAPEKIPSGSAVAAACGVTLGFTTQVANAAGPVAAIYFLAMKLPKEKYMGCSAWFFLIINWTKLPIFLWEGRITMEALKIDLMMIPFLLIGAALGILLLSRMPQKLFENIIQVLVVLTAIKLFF